MKKFDVAIVGAGPAGSFLAYRLASKGISVGILEKNELPRYKACGGGITRKAMDLLDFDISSVVHATPGTAVISFRGGNSHLIQPSRPVAWTVMRDSFDHFLVQKACNAGVELLEGRRVTTVEDGRTLSTNGETVSADVVVGADGVLSLIARQSGIRTRIRTATAIESEVYVNDALLAKYQDVAVFDFDGIKRGYGWVFPKKDHLSVGLCTTGRKITSINSTLAEFVQIHLGEGNPREVIRKGHLVPSGDATLRFSQGKVLLVGDAAGLADPFTGEGIFYALKSAELAAHSISKYLEGMEDDLSGYDDLVKKEFHREFLWARRAARVIYSFPRLCHKIFTGNNSIRNEYARVLAGEIGYWPFVKGTLTDVRAVMRGFGRG